VNGLIPVRMWTAKPASPRRATSACSAQVFFLSLLWFDLRRHGLHLRARVPLPERHQVVDLLGTAQRVRAQGYPDPEREQAAPLRLSIRHEGGLTPPPSAGVSRDAVMRRFNISGAQALGAPRGQGAAASPQIVRRFRQRAGGRPWLVSLVPSSGGVAAVCRRLVPWSWPRRRGRRRNPAGRAGRERRREAGGHAAREGGEAHPPTIVARRIPGPFRIASLWPDCWLPGRAHAAGHG
jgi:hypothetical protein